MPLPQLTKKEARQKKLLIPFLIVLRLPPLEDENREKIKKSITIHRN